MKHHLSEPVAHVEFERLMQTPADTLTDIPRAAWFFYLAKTCFGANVHKPRKLSTTIVR